MPTFALASLQRPRKRIEGQRDEQVKRIKVKMEKTVRILDQSALSTRKYTDEKTGQEKVMNAVTFKLTDGIDTFLGEVTGERAVNCPLYDKNYVYRVQCSMVVRDWTSQQTGEQMQATTIYIEKINMV